MFGGDGSNDASQFKAAGLVRLELRAGHHRHRGRREDHRRLEEGQPRQGRRLLRPADLRRGQIALNAISKACKAGHGSIDPRCRLPHVQEGEIKNWILGGIFQLVDEVERPAEREVLHLPDPVERLVQARRLADRAELTLGGAARASGRPAAYNDTRRGPVHPAHRRRPDARQRLRADRARLHARLRRPEAPQLRARRRLHGRHVRRLRRAAGCSAAPASPKVPVWLAAHARHARGDGRCARRSASRSSASPTGRCATRRASRR